MDAGASLVRLRVVVSVEERAGSERYNSEVVDLFRLFVGEEILGESFPSAVDDSGRVGLPTICRTLDWLRRPCNRKGRLANGLDAGLQTDS